MTEQKQLVQRKINQLVFLHASHVLENYGKIRVNQSAEYKRIYADWQAGHVTLDEIQADINEYLKMREDGV